MEDHPLQIVVLPKRIKRVFDGSQVGNGLPVATNPDRLAALNAANELR
jgi:hypothetical protein